KPEKKPDDPDRKKDDAKIDEKKKDDKEVAKDDDKDKKSDDKDKDEKKEDKEDKPPKPVEIDLADFERRAVVLPLKAGNYDDVFALNGKLVFRRLPRAGSADEKSTLLFYDLEKREDKTILEDVDDVIPAAKGDKILVRRKAEYAIIEPKDGQKFEKKLSL